MVRLPSNEREFTLDDNWSLLKRVARGSKERLTTSITATRLGKGH
jgi:hypothetical protein